MADDVIITPTNDGPYWVRGSIALQLPSGKILKTEGETWLCRCGHSEDKPFCDGHHKTIGFKAREGDETSHRE